MGKIPVLTNIFEMGWNHQLDHLLIRIPVIQPVFQVRVFFFAWLNLGLRLSTCWSASSFSWDVNVQAERVMLWTRREGKCRQFEVLFHDFPHRIHGTGRFTYIWLVCIVCIINVGKYTIHGWYRLWLIDFVWFFLYLLMCCSFYEWSPPSDIWLKQPQDGPIPSLKLTARTWKWMVRILVSFLGWPIFKCYMLVLGSVASYDMSMKISLASTPKSRWRANPWPMTRFNTYF